MSATASTRTILAVDPSRVREIKATHAVKFKNTRSLTELKAMSIRIDPSSFSREVRAYFLSIKPDTVVYIPTSSSGYESPVAYLSEEAALTHWNFLETPCIPMPYLTKTTMLDFVNTISVESKFPIIKHVRKENLCAWKKTHLS